MRAHSVGLCCFNHLCHEKLCYIIFCWLFWTTSSHRQIWSSSITVTLTIAWSVDVFTDTEYFWIFCAFIRLCKILWWFENLFLKLVFLLVILVNFLIILLFSVCSFHWINEEISVCLSACLSVCMSICLQVYLSASLYTCLSVCWSVWGKERWVSLPISKNCQAMLIRQGDVIV